MSLSFREQAVIALYGRVNDEVQAAQNLAHECCRQWGHEIVNYHDCERCGKKGIDVKNCDCVDCFNKAKKEIEK